MRILIMANNDVGLYQFRRELIFALLKKKHDVFISLPDGSFIASLQEAGCTFLDTPIDRRGINPITDFRLLLRYRRILREVNPELVITYTIKPNIYGGLMCRLMRIHYAANITGLGTAFQKQGALRKFVAFLYTAALKKADMVFFENSDNMRIFLNEKIVSEKKCRLLNGAGVNLAHYACVPYSEEVSVRFLFVGRVMKEKGINELFAAMERLYSEGEACFLDVVGGCEENYAEIIRQYETQGWLNYHGYQKDVRPFIEKAHCFVLPSYHEGMANTNLECAAMGRPLITSNIPGCKEAVIDGESGLLCEPKDTDSLYNVMKRFLSLPLDEKIRMGNMGRSHMENVFDKKKVIEQTLEGLGL